MWGRRQLPLEFAGNMFMIKGILGPRAGRHLSRAGRLDGLQGMTEFAQQYPDERRMAWALNPDITPGEMSDELTWPDTAQCATPEPWASCMVADHTVGGGVHLAYHLETGADR